MKLIKNKNIPNASVSVIKLKKEDVASRADELFNHYLEGGIIVIEKFRPIGVNYSALQYCSQKACMHSWHERSIKKMHTSKFLEAAGASGELKEEMLASEKNIVWSIFEIFRDLLSAIDISDAKIMYSSIWRCLPVISEDYHVDVYQDTPLRAYWNLDNSPRVWGFGHSSLDVLQIFEAEACLQKILNYGGSFKDGFQRELNKTLTQLAHSLEFHIAEFDPYDLWIADGTRGFHKIIYGKNMLSQNLTISNNDCKKLDTALNYKNWIKSHAG